MKSGLQSTQSCLTDNQVLLSSSSLYPHTSPPAATACILHFFFFNSSYSEKETLGTLSNENPGIHESWVRHVNGLQSENPLPKTLWATAFSGLRILAGRRVSLCGYDISRQGWNAQMGELRGPGARRELGCDITKGLLTTLHPAKTTETVL